jgi:predicted dehydrogenase
MQQDESRGSSNRRDFLKAAGVAGNLTTNATFTGRVRGANDRVAVGFIGMGTMGTGNLGFAMKVEQFQPVAVCDVYQPHLERAEAAAKKAGVTVRGVKDFREILVDKSIDAVCISTPDHWHAYMTVEACKAGKDVFVEKPACVYVDEGPKMVEAARKYKRVVQAGTMQRSGGYFLKAKEIAESGALGEITFCHTWQAGSTPKEQWGNPKDSDPPAGLDWDMWLGPAPKVAVQSEPLGHRGKALVHVPLFLGLRGRRNDGLGRAPDRSDSPMFGEPMPLSIVTLGAKYYVTDNVETPDTMLATFQYPKWLQSYESRTANSTPMFGQGAATSIHGTEGTLVVNRSGCWVTPTRGSKLEAVSYENNREMAQLNVPHWQNFLECIRSRQKPISRYRDLRAVFRDVHPRQSLHALPNEAGLG